MTTAGNTNNAFTIIATTGEIRTLTTLDYEATTNYNLEVTATDGGTTPKTQSATVSIDISNVNDNAPSCTNYYIAVTLAESAAVNDAVRDGSLLRFFLVCLCVFVCGSV